MITELSFLGELQYLVNCLHKNLKVKKLCKTHNNAVSHHYTKFREGLHIPDSFSASFIRFKSSIYKQLTETVL